MDEKYIKSKNGQMKLCQTTIGWSFLVRMKDGTESWTPLKVQTPSTLQSMLWFMELIKSQILRGGSHTHYESVVLLSLLSTRVINRKSQVWC